MAKKTRKESLETRELLLDAAEALFMANGVSRTSLQQIAQTAGLTRGAVYWHFTDKVHLLQSLLDRASISVDDALDTISNNASLTPAEKILTLISSIIRLVHDDLRIRNAVEIVTNKIELVGEFAIMNELYLKHLNKILNFFTLQILRECENRNIAIQPAQAKNIARAIKGIMDGLFQSWIISPADFDLHHLSIVTIKTYLYGLLTKPEFSSSTLTLDIPSPLCHKN